MLDFSNSKILIVGDVMLDKYYFGKVDRISPEAPVPIVNIQKEESVGRCLNVANNIVSLGGHSLLWLSAMIFSVKRSNGSAATKISTPFC
ncbi:MAG: hypothetical protein ACLTZU_16185 [Odoribacter splanchnicus]